MGHLLGHGVQLGMANEAMAAGEGIVTMLSLRTIMSGLPMIAALSANQFAAILFPAAVRRLYVARDSDSPGDAAPAILNDRAADAGIDVLSLSPALSDFNENLLCLGIGELLANLRIQLVPRHSDFDSLAMSG
jgi:Toprim domain